VRSVVDERPRCRIDEQRRRGCRRVPPDTRPRTGDVLPRPRAAAGRHAGRRGCADRLGPRGGDRRRQHGRRLRGRQLAGHGDALRTGDDPTGRPGARHGGDRGPRPRPDPRDHLPALRVRALRSAGRGGAGPRLRHRPAAGHGRAADLRHRPRPRAHGAGGGADERVGLRDRGLPRAASGGGGPLLRVRADLRCRLLRGRRARPIGPLHGAVGHDRPCIARRSLGRERHRVRPRLWG
jgi:hypothetical protein